MAASAEYRKAWREKHKERIKERSALYYEKNREDVTRKNREARAREPERFKAYDRRYDLLKRYGVSLEMYDEMLASQRGLCAICASAPDGKQLAVDHCHTTGLVRGLLCGRCNIGIGNFRDSKEFLTAAVEYLSRGS